MESNMALENLLILMVLSILVNGTTISNMERANYSNQRARLRKEHGGMVSNWKILSPQ
jgi:hypothetical protein